MQDLINLVIFIMVLVLWLDVRSLKKAIKDADQQNSNRMADIGKLRHWSMEVDHHLEKLEKAAYQQRVADDKGW